MMSIIGVVGNQLSVSLDAILSSQKAAFLSEGPPPLAVRKRHLEKLKQAVISHRREIEAAISLDFGHRSAHETSVLEILPLLDGIRYLSQNLASFMRPSHRSLSTHMLFGNARVEYQPLGVVGIMAPWNYPLALTLMPLATALAAGNRAMIKPSEFTPAFNDLLKSMLSSVFSVEQVAVVTGDVNTGVAFSALPFDHLIFTGSTAVGRAVMRSASHNLVPVTLELGGKSPVIIEKGSVDSANVDSIVFGKLLNSGQTCIAPDYTFVHESDLETFLQLFDVAVRKYYPEGPHGQDFSSIISDVHHKRLNALVEDAAAKGAKIISLGVNFDPNKSPKRTMTPKIILNVNDQMKIAQEEIFGPLMPVFTYTSIDKVIHDINARPRPLALYFFGPAGAIRAKVLSRTTSGNVTINSTVTHYAQDDLPFGGVGASGMGAYHGIEGFRALSHAKGIFEQSRWSTLRLIRPPFSAFVEGIIKILLRRP